MAVTVPALSVPASVARPSRVARRFTVRRNLRGLWVAREARGLVEGILFEQRDAIRFAIAESGGRPFVLVIGAG